MKTKITEGLKAKFPGVSNSIIGRVADKLAKTATTEDEATAAVEGVTFQQMLDNYADSRVTEATQTAVSKYEKQHGLKDGKPATGEPGEPEKQKTPDDTPAWAKALIDKSAALEAKISAMEGDKTANTRKKQLAEALDKAPDKLRSRYEKDLARMNFKDDAEYNEWLTEVKTDTEALVAEANTKGAVFGRPMNGGKTPPPDKPSAEVEARIKARQAEPETSAIAGLPK